MRTAPPPAPTQFYCVSITLPYDACSHSCRTRNKIPRPRGRHIQTSKCPRELCSMWCGSLDGRGIWGRKDTWIYMVESFHPSPEIITTLFVNWLYYNKKKKSKCPEEKNECRACVGRNLGYKVLGVCGLRVTEKGGAKRLERSWGVQPAVLTSLSVPWELRKGSVSYPRHS